ncbi:MAG: RNA-binding S4 domain-containing protein [Acidobacteria bacterium]|nr:RNA-binding S4 domain-containing protein [Acidobacteriota bacterium]
MPFRLDKWLWAARFFKTRTLAARACHLGRVLCNEQTAKPARELRVGERLHIKNDSGDFEVEVLLLAEVRGPAAAAQTLYRETKVSREMRLRLIEERKSMMNFSPAPKGRPTKRERRKIAEFRRHS